MLARLYRAVPRAAVIGAVVAAPSLMLPHVATGSSETVVLAAGAAALLVAVEYAVRGPGLIEFREAPPYNRIRVCALAATVGAGAAVFAGEGPLAGLLRAFGAAVAYGLAVPGSPVETALTAFPEGTGTAPLVGFAALFGLAAVIALTIAIRARGWPGGRDGFNLWVNLPTFDPSRPRGLARRLRRLAWVNLLLASAAAYAGPGLATRAVGDAALASNELLLLWTVTAWGLVPALCAMRAVALFRVAALQGARAHGSVVPSLAC